MTTQRARKLHLHRVSAVDLQIIATLEGPCLCRHLPAPGRWPPLLPTPALWLWEPPGPGQG